MPWYCTSSINLAVGGVCSQSMSVANTGWSCGHGRHVYTVLATVGRGGHAYHRSTTAAGLRPVPISDSMFEKLKRRVLRRKKNGKNTGNRDKAKNTAPPAIAFVPARPGPVSVCTLAHEPSEAWWQARDVGGRPSSSNGHSAPLPAQPYCHVRDEEALVDGDPFARFSGVWPAAYFDIDIPGQATRDGQFDDEQLILLFSPTPALEPLDSLEEWADDAVSVLVLDTSHDARQALLRRARSFSCPAPVAAHGLAVNVTDMHRPAFTKAVNNERLGHALLIDGELEGQLRGLLRIYGTIKHQGTRAEQLEIAHDEPNKFVEEWRIPGAWIDDAETPELSKHAEMAVPPSNVVDAGEDAEVLLKDLFRSLEPVLCMLGKALAEHDAVQHDHDSVAET